MDLADSPVRPSTRTNSLSKPSTPTTTKYDDLEAAAIQAQTPPRLGRMSTDHEDPITALDELDEAVEQVNAELPGFETSPQKPKAKKAPIVRGTRASQARISLAHGPKDATQRTSSWGKPPAQSTGSRVASNSSTKSGPDASERKDVEIPHSKPRPISMSFPTPPPPPKSTKAPTTSNFQLPGEAVAAKLKAAKEARLQKEADEQKKKAFKARPAPSMTSGPKVRQTSTSTARQSLMNGKPRSPLRGPERSNSAAATRPSTGTSTQSAQSPTGAAKRSAALNRFSVGPAASIGIVKRPSTAMASFSKARPSSAFSKPLQATSAAKPTGPPSPTARPASSIGGRRANGISKGKEVFNRAAHAKSLAEKEKRDKEEAAKKARSEAAERSRQLSREWAEKQRLKKLGISTKRESKSKENVDPVGDVSSQSIEGDSEEQIVQASLES